MRKLLERMAEFGDSRYDPDWRLLKLPATRNFYTEYLEPLESSERHLVRESLYYALVLLERANTGDVARAEAILQAIEELQVKQPGHPRDGLWHYHAEESVLDWPIPDFNWADFNGMTLLMIWHLKRELLSAPMRERVREMIRRAAHSVMRRNVNMDYTNIAIKGTFVTLSAAEVLDDAQLMTYATDRAVRLHEEAFRTDSFAEYNSPVYASVSIAGLMAIDAFVRHEPSKKLAREIQHRFWQHIASHWHAPTGELAGPHSRTYQVRLHDRPLSPGAMIVKASGGRIPWHIPDDPNEVGLNGFYGYFLDPNIPPDMASLLSDVNRVQTVVEITARRGRRGDWWKPIGLPETRDDWWVPLKELPARITTFLHPAFCLGSVNLMDGWEQRQNLIAYWNGGGAKPSYLLHRYLHDRRPCCSGYLASAQREGCALATAFLVDFCDHNPAAPADEITAEFLGTSVQIDNEGQPIELWIEEQPIAPGMTEKWQDGQHLWLRLPTVWIAFRLLRHWAEPASDITPTAHFEGTRLELRLPHYQGPPKRLRWTDLRSTHTSYGLWMSAPQADWEQWRQGVRRQNSNVVTRAGELVDVTLDDLRLTVPATTVHRERLPLIVSA
jgi:hypothetical protein